MEWARLDIYCLRKVQRRQASVLQAAVCCQEGDACTSWVRLSAGRTVPVPTASPCCLGVPRDLREKGLPLGVGESWGWGVWFMP